MVKLQKMPEDPLFSVGISHIIMGYAPCAFWEAMGMDERPIGVFDSGLGGLTAVRELAKLLPGEDIVYFGDTGRVPYGSRSPETIRRYARQDVAFLQTFDLKSIVIACGTVSSTALEDLSARCPIPVRGVVAPAAQAAARATRTGRIGLIGTQATIRAGAYERAILALLPGAEVTALACPLFVPLVENGRFRRGDRVAGLVAEEYLAPMRDAGVDTLVLGCTHYPLLTDVIRDAMGPQVTLVNVGEMCARQVAEELRESGGLAEREGRGRRRYFVSDSTDDFARLASVFLGEDVQDEVAQIDITRY